MEKQAEQKRIIAPERSLFYRIMVRSYTAIKISLFFWCYLVRGIFTLRVADACSTAFQVNKLAQEDAALRVKESFKSNFQNIYHDRIINILVPLVTIYFGFFIVVPFSTKIPQNSISFIKYFSVICFLVWQVIVSSGFSSDLVLTHWHNFFWFGFMYGCRHFIYTIVVFVLTIGCFWFAGKNFIFLLFFQPGFYILFIQGIISNFINKEKVKQ